MEKKICEYRNCKREITDNKRSDAKFCQKSCQSNEATYRRRQKKFIEKYKMIELDKVLEIKKLKAIIEEKSELLKVIDK